MVVRVEPSPGARPRLDRALADALALEGIACTRSRLAAAFAEGGVRIDGRVAKPSQRVGGAVEVTVSADCFWRVSRLVAKVKSL